MVDTKVIISAQDKTREAIASVRKNLDGLNKSGAATALNLAGIGTALSVVGFASFVKNGIDAIDALGDLSDRTNIAVADLAALEFVATQTDTSVESLGKSINRLSLFYVQNADEAKKLGISAQDPLERFIQLSRTLGAIQDPALRAAVAQRVLGKSYEEVLPALLKGEQALRDLIKQGKEINPVTEEMKDQAGRLNDEWDKAGFQLRQFKINAASFFIPAINDIIDRLKLASKEGGIFNTVMAGLNQAGVAGNLAGAYAGAKVASKLPVVGKNPFVVGAGAVAGAVAPEFFDNTAPLPAKVDNSNDAKIARLERQLKALIPNEKNAQKIAELNAKLLQLKQPQLEQKPASQIEEEARKLFASDEEKKRAKEAEAEAKRLAKQRATDAKREAEAAAKAQIELTNTLADNAAKLNDEQLANAANNAQREFDAKKISAEQYYALIEALENRRTQIEIANLNQRLQQQQAILASNAPQSDKLKAQAEISDIQTAIALAETRLQEFKAKANQGLVDAQTDRVKTEFEQVKTQIDNALENLRNREQQINNRVQLGLPEITGEQQINAVRRETVDIVTELLDKLQGIADANPQAFGEDSRRLIEQYRDNLQQTTVATNSAAARINAAAENEFGGLFRNIIKGSEDAEDAVINMLANIADAIAQEASRNLGQTFFRSIFGTSSGGGGGLGGFFASLIGGGGGGFELLPDFVPAFGFSGGGYTGDGGKYEPKGIVHGGEYVFSKAATSYLGVNALARLHALAEHAPSRPRFSYADGGLVDIPAGQGAAAQPLTIINTIDKDEVQNAAFGSGSTKKLLNIITANRSVFKTALGN